MGQHPVYNGVIKSKGAIKMIHRELRTMLKRISEYQLKQITQAAPRFLALNLELAETTSDICPHCSDQNPVFICTAGQYGEQRFPRKSCGSKFTYAPEQFPP